MIAAAISGGIISANSGIAGRLAPEKPPFANPNSATAGSATA